MDAYEKGPRAATLEPQEQRTSYTPRTSRVSTILLLLEWERADFEADIPEQSTVTFNGPLSRRLDGVIVAIEALGGVL